MMTTAEMIDALKGKDEQQRLSSIKKLASIAEAIGEERTRTELIQYLAGSVYDEDVVMLEIVDQLSNMTPYVGGPNYVQYLLPPLENLAGIEETVVRDKAAKLLHKLAGEHSSAALEEHFIPMVLRLAKSDWFPSRISACGLFSVAYSRATPNSRVELRGAFRVLCKDEIPTVRRAAAAKLGDLAKVLEQGFVKNLLLAIYEELTKDEQDYVRMSAVEAGVVIIQLLRNDPAKLAKAKSIVSAQITDKSWRVRCMAAEKIVKLQDAFGDKLPIDEMVAIYTKVLNDAEPEVRCAAVAKLRGRQKRIVTVILPVVKRMMADKNQHVKTALAKVVMGLVSLLDRQASTEHLLPIFFAMLRDDTAEVRLNIISSLDKVNDVIGVSELQLSLLPAIMDLRQDGKWHIRLAVLEHMPLLASRLGQAFFSEHLFSLCADFLVDPVLVYAIRIAATLVLRQLAERFGLVWTQKMVMPKLMELTTNADYLLRMTCLFCFNTLYEVLPKDYITAEMLPVFKKLAGDRVPNVRFNVAKTLTKVGTVLDQHVLNDEVKPIITKLCTDIDPDVRYFAGESGKALRLWEQENQAEMMDVDPPMQ